MPIQAPASLGDEPMRKRLFSVDFVLPTSLTGGNGNNTVSNSGESIINSVVSLPSVSVVGSMDRTPKQVLIKGISTLPMPKLVNNKIQKISSVPTAFPGDIEVPTTFSVTFYETHNGAIAGMFLKWLAKVAYFNNPKGQSTANGAKVGAYGKSTLTDTLGTLTVCTYGYISNSLPSTPYTAGYDLVPIIQIQLTVFVSDITGYEGMAVDADTFVTPTVTFGIRNALYYLRQGDTIDDSITLPSILGVSSNLASVLSQQGSNLLSKGVAAVVGKLPTSLQPAIPLIANILQGGSSSGSSNGLTGSIV